MPGMKEKEWSRWALIVTGLGFLAAGGFFITDTISTLVNGTAETEGTVVGEKLKDAGEGVVRLPIVTFVTEDGRSIVFTSKIGSGEDIGESVNVRYDPDGPTNAKIDSFHNLWFIPNLFLVIGGIMTFFGIRHLRGKSPGATEPDASRNG